MGLIRAGIGALGGVLADQWKEFFYCDALDMDTLVVKGQKKTGRRSSNTTKGIKRGQYFAVYLFKFAGVGLININRQEFISPLIHFVAKLHYGIKALFRCGKIACVL